MTAQIPAPTSLVGTHIRLDPLSESDLPQLYKAIAKPEVFAGGYGGGPANFHADLAGFIAWAKSGFQWESGRPFAVRIATGSDAGTVIGTSSLAEFDTVKERTHLGWTAYNPRVWGSVVNPEAKLLLLTHAFDNGFGRVKIQADSVNEHSRHAILKLGAKFEGIIRRDQKRADGTWRDAAVHSIIIDEWPEVRAQIEARIAAFGTDPILLRE